MLEAEKNLYVSHEGLTILAYWFKFFVGKIQSRRYIYH